jgi:hypothetical protein
MNASRRHPVLLVILLMFGATALHAQSGRDAAIRGSRSRAHPMLSATVSFSGNYSYTFGGGTATLKVDTVTNDGSTATGNLRLALLMTTSPYPSSGSTTATYQFAPIAAHSSTSNVNSGSVPFTLPPTGCYYVTLVLQEFIGGNWTDDDYGSFSLTIDIGGGCISSFTATPPAITSGQSSTLAWSTKPTISAVSIDNGGGSFGPNGSTSVHPTATTTYTLTATGTANGNTVQKAVTVTLAPAITSITPNHGPIAGGTSVTISGTSLSGVTSVSFGGTAATLGTNTSTSIIVTTPAHTAGGVVVTLTNPGGTATTNFTYDAPNVPAITSITPSHGPAAGGTALTIAGANLSGATSVVFGSTNATITANTATSLSVTSPAHAAGEVLVRVTTPLGSAAVPFTYDAPADTTELLPVVGSLPGNFGSFFRTSLQLNNTTAQPLTGKLVFHSQGQQPSPSDPSLNYTVAAGETKFYPDVLPAMNTSGLGSLDLQPATGTAAPLALIRIFNDGGAAGTTGMTIGFTPSSGALKSGDTAVLLAPPSTTAFRFNLGVRALGDGVSMTAVVRDSSGAQKRSVPLSYGANTFTQATASSQVGDLAPNDSITFSITAGSALIYGSSTNNTTQDPSYQAARRVPILTTATAVVPVVGSLPGNFGSFFRTAVQMFNPLSSTMHVRVVFHTQGQSGADTDPSIQVSLAPGETKYYSDILPALSLSGLGSLDLVPLDGALPLAVTRIYNDGGANGTTGMTLDAIVPDDALQSGQTAVLVAPSSTTDFRYNIGIRTLSNGVSMQVTLRDSSGNIKKTTTASYGPNFFVQVSAATFAGTDVAANDSITISINSGAAVIYGATTDNRTQDPSAQVAVGAGS